MSRARPIIYCAPDCPPGCKEHSEWFDTTRNGERASDEKLELLATIEGVDLDDLLDTVLTQGEVLQRLRLALGDAPVPTDVLIRREAWRQARHRAPQCVKCGKEGDSTKHHFVNRWILKELDSYERKWSNRSKNCIPVCIGCHRRLHQRDDEDKSIAPYLTDDQKRFVNAALTTLGNERPGLLIRIGQGDRGVYEARLVKDWFNDAFEVAEPVEQLHLRVVA